MQLSILSIMIAISGCGISVYLHTETDPDFVPGPRGYRFHLLIPDGASIQQKMTIRDLREVMQAKGFAITDSIADEQDLVVFVEVGSHLYETTSAVVLPFTSSTRGSIGGTSYQSSTTSWEVVPYSSSSYNYQLLIGVCAWKPQESTGEVVLDPMWNGYLDVKASDFEKDPKFFLSRLLDNFGRNKRGTEDWRPADGGSQKATAPPNWYRDYDR